MDSENAMALSWMLGVVGVVNLLNDRKKGLVDLWVGNNSGGDFANFSIIPAA
jgi:hypothetical protein